MNKKEHMLIIEKIAHRSGRPLPEVKKKYKNTISYQMDMLKEAWKELVDTIKSLTD